MPLRIYHLTGNQNLTPIFARPFSSNHQRRSRWLQRTAKWTAFSILGLGTAFAVDKTYNASSWTRNLRTLWTCAMITLDYKLNFSPEKSDKIPELHERVAERIYNLLTANGGLYIKIGQSIGNSAAVLPQPMQIKFASLFDDAPQVSYSVIHDVFVKELGRPPCGADGIFEIFEEQATASASIAQVHKAKLWPRIAPDGTPEKEEQWVAVKIQKPDVSKQMEWDLGAYRIVMWLFENVAFDLPVYFVVDFVSDHLRQELDFIREGENSRRTAELIAKEPRLRDKVYIPKVYPEYSTKRVMTAEWIDGVRLSDRDGIFLLMGEKPPPVSSSYMLPDHASDSASSSLPAFKPLKGGVRSIMQTMVELFSAQMFEWGWVHCDPHPGNILIRPSPSDPSHPQLVLIDHGLYVGLPDDFRRDWARLWRSTLEGNYEEVEKVVKGWGIGLPDLMASFTLLRPTILKKGRKKAANSTSVGLNMKSLTHYERSVLTKAKLKEFLLDTDRMPKELIFLSKNTRMVQGNNQLFRSPVNRIRITGYWASRSQFLNPTHSFRDLLHGLYRHLIFQAVMFSIDVAFYANRFRSSLELCMRRMRAWCSLGEDELVMSRDFEEEIEKQVRVAAQEYLGVEIGDSFLG